MKKLGLFGKILFWCNIFVAILLVVSFVLPFMKPSRFPTLSLLSLAVSPLILFNIIFVIYWLVRVRIEFVISLIVLIIAGIHFNSFFEFSSEGDPSEYSNTLTLLSYNVRLFNAYEKEPSKDFLTSFSELIKEKQPDVLCIQEYYKKFNLNFSSYPHRYIHYNGDNSKLGHAIFSKYPIITSGAFDFEATSNNALFADIVKNKDTIRVYNLHLQSMGILPSVDYLQEGNKDKLKKRISNAFVNQERQIQKILKHKATSPFPVIMGGDFNNTPFSYTYHTLQAGMQDAFVERGHGLGTTFLFDSYPMRIDYILVSPQLNVLSFETVKKSFSDHYPISATVGW